MKTNSITIMVAAGLLLAATNTGWAPTMNTPPATSACFSMRIALEPAMPAYSGGPGVLAGDTIRSVVDLKVPRVAVTLLHRKEQRPPGKCGALETKKWGAW